MFISFEGIDGSGKSTQIDLLAERLRREGADVEVFREPGGTILAEQIRDLLLNPAYEIHPFAELLLFSAARAQLVARSIVPALEKGRVVLCDRFYDSTTAYQGGGRQIEQVDWLTEFHHKVTGGLTPDRTYLLMLPVSVALNRRAERGAGDRMERAGEAFYERVSATYMTLTQKEPDRFLVLDALQAPESVHELIWNDIVDMRA